VADIARHADVRPAGTWLRKIALWPQVPASIPFSSGILMILQTGSILVVGGTCRSCLFRGACIMALDEEDDDHCGRGDYRDAGFEPVVAGRHVEGVGCGHYAEGDDDEPEEDVGDVEAHELERGEVEGDERELEDRGHGAQEDQRDAGEGDECGLLAPGYEAVIVYNR